jgi:hypothetical protein
MDPQEIVQTLADLGMDRQSRQALLLLPLVRVAWADGKIKDAARTLILRFADDRAKLGEEGALLLADWLRYAPSARYFQTGQKLLRALLDQRSPDVDEKILAEMLTTARQVAKSTGGWFGFGRISAEESRALDEIEASLKRPHLDAPSNPESRWGARVTMMAIDETDETIDGTAPQLAGVLVIEDDRGRHKLLVGEAGLILGAGADAQVRLDGDKVAPRHCRVIERRRRYYVEDLDAPIGTYVNGERVGTRRLLGGETLKVGSREVVFKMGRRS